MKLATRLRDNADFLEHHHQLGAYAALRTLQHGLQHVEAALSIAGLRHGLQHHFGATFVHELLARIRVVAEHQHVASFVRTQPRQLAAEHRAKAWLHIIIT